MRFLVVIASVSFVQGCAGHTQASPAERTTVAAPPSLTPTDVANFRGSKSPDVIDSLLSKMFTVHAEIVEFDGLHYYFSGERDTAYQRLAEMSESIPRLVECLGWDRFSRTTWRGEPLRVGIVCGRILSSTPYVQRRVNPLRLSPDLLEEGFGGDYRNGTIEKLLKSQKAWREQLRRDPV